VPRPLEADELSEALEEAVVALPRALAAALVGVPRRVERWPSDAELLRTPGRLSPLCLVRLAPGSDAESAAPGGDHAGPPAAVVLYGDNAAFVARDPESLVQELRPALWEEVIRHLGLERDDVEQAGLH